MAVWKCTSYRGTVYQPQLQVAVGGLWPGGFSEGVVGGGRCREGREGAAKLIGPPMDSNCVNRASKALVDEFLAHFPQRRSSVGTQRVGANPFLILRVDVGGEPPLRTRRAPQGREPSRLPSQTKHP